MNISATLYIAMSADGFIAMPDGNSDWVSDSDYFDQTLEDSGCYVLGRTTFDQYVGDLFPIEGLKQCILSNSDDGTDYSAASPSEALTKLSETGFTSTVVIGGAKTWTSFINAGLADQLVIEIEPLMLGSGMTIGQVADFKKLNLVSSDTDAEGKIRNVYNF